jgi:hypothetical protein
VGLCQGNQTCRGGQVTLTLLNENSKSFPLLQNLIFVPFGHYDEPEILSYAIRLEHFRD